jgi:hypothetical protein
MPFRKGKAGRGRRAVRPPAPRRTVEMLERRDLLALVVEPLSLTEDVPFSGLVATFPGSDLPMSSISDFKPSITWGDGTTSPSPSAPTSAQVVPDGMNFDVFAQKTYTQFGTFPVTVMVSGANNTSVFGTGQASVGGAPLIPAGTTFTATPGQVFNGVVGSFFDVNPSSTGTDFSVRIDWGDGQISAGTAALAPPTGQTGALRYNVSGTHVYPTTGVNVVKVTIVRSSSGQSVVADSTANVVAPGLTIPFTGGLDPLSFPRRVRGLVVTNQQEPILTGTASPGSSVSLSLRRLGLGDPITLGETMADPSGRWSLVVGPLGGPPFTLYGVATPVDGPPSPITPLNGGLPILITNRSLHVINRLVPRHGEHPHHRVRLG